MKKSEIRRIAEELRTKISAADTDNPPWRTYDSRMATCLAGLCDVCEEGFLIPVRTPDDMLVTCPRCEHVNTCKLFLDGWREADKRGEIVDG